MSSAKEGPSLEGVYARALQGRKALDALFLRLDTYSELGVEMAGSERRTLDEPRLKRLEAGLTGTLTGIDEALGSLLKRMPPLQELMEEMLKCVLDLEITQISVSPRRLVLLQRTI